MLFYDSFKWGGATHNATYRNWIFTFIVCVNFLKCLEFNKLITSIRANYFVIFRSWTSKFHLFFLSWFFLSNTCILFDYSQFHSNKFPENWILNIFQWTKHTTRMIRWWKFNWIGWILKYQFKWIMTGYFLLKFACKFEMTWTHTKASRNDEREFIKQH